MKTTARHHGFTFMEMLFALVALGTIGAAIAGLLVSAGDAWQTRDDYRRQITDGRSIMANVTEWVRAGRRVVSVPVTDDGRYHNLVLWHNDDQFEGAVNLSELRVLTYDADNERLTLYAADLNPTQTVSEGTNVEFTPADVGDSSFPATFRARNDVNAYVLAEDVTNFEATVVAPGEDEPSYRLVELEIALAGPEGTDSQVELTTAFVRAPDYEIDFEN